MSWDLFTRIVDQYPTISWVVLHGVGEPMKVKDLPRMVRYLKDRGTASTGMLAGLMFLWTSPRACSCATARATAMAIRRNSATAIGAPMTASSGSPSGPASRNSVRPRSRTSSRG
jgi:hypothetical protein